jgi:hypothetical protein
MTDLIGIATILQLIDVVALAAMLHLGWAVIRAFR